MLKYLKKDNVLEKKYKIMLTHKLMIKIKILKYAKFTDKYKPPFLYNKNL